MAATPLTTILLFSAAAFVGIWVGSSLIVNSIEKLAHSIRISRFIVSFVLLGMLTSVSEIGVAINSYIEGKPGVSVGNLLGGIIVLFLFVMPVLALAGNGIKLGKKMDKGVLIVALLTLMFPAYFMLDGLLQNREAIALIVAYAVTVLIAVFSNTNGFNFKNPMKIASKKRIKYLFYIIGGASVLFISSDVLVTQIIDLATFLNVTPFIISLLGLSLGTNLPELSLAVKSILKGENDVAFGNYLGSSVFNVLILGVLGLVSNRISLTDNGSFVKVLIFTVGGLILFFYFTRSKNDLSRKEGLILLILYALFVLSELVFAI